MRRLALILAVFTAVPVIAGAQEMKGMVMDSATAAPSAKIEIKDFDYSPMNVIITAGGTVTWTNRDGEPHTITSLDGQFRSGALDQDQSFTFKFEKPGTYSYLCSIHPKMRATVTVR